MYIVKIADTFWLYSVDEPFFYNNMTLKRHKALTFVTKEAAKNAAERILRRTDDNFTIEKA